MSTPKRQHQSLATIDIQKRIERLYDHLYANSPVRTPAGIAREVGKLLHTGMFIEQNNPRLFGNQFDYLPAFNFKVNDVRRLTRCEDDLYKTVANDVRSKFRTMNEKWCLYNSQDEIHLSDADIAYCCGELSGIIISDPEKDVFGDALEIFRGQWAKRASGQFFTDSRVTALAMKLIEFDPRNGDDLVDLCSGTAGFLLAGLNHIRKLIESEDGSLDEKELVELSSISLKGQEIDKEVCEIANATLAARLSAFDRSCVVNGDSLKQPYEHPLIKNGSHLCAATNPPFGTKITIKDSNLLKNYDLAVTGGRVAGRSPDILFIEQNLRLLKPGKGRLAIVVPYQVLSGPQTLYVREWILKQAHVMAVIDLPADTFQPHTGTKGALLVLKKRLTPLSSLNEVEDGKIFMSMPRWIGHDRRGRPVCKRNADGSLSGEVLSDFGEVEQAFKEFIKAGNPTAVHEQSFVTAMSQILADPERRMNASFHRPSKEGHDVNYTIGNHSKSWRVVKISDVVERIFYPTRFKRNYVDHYPDAVPFLGGANISQLAITTNKWLRHDDPKLNDLRVKAGWILITRSGSTGIVSVVPKAWDGYAMSEHIIRIIPNPEKLDPSYIYSFLRTHYAQDILARGVFGSVIDEITPEFIGSISMPIPKSGQVLENLVSKTTRGLHARDEAIKLLSESEDEINSRLLDRL